jgi:localization factor PodJL
MAHKLRWSVTGVLPECREAAKVAARRAGMSIGEWLNRAIMDAAKQAVQGSPNAPVINHLPALPVS